MNEGDETNLVDADKNDARTWLLDNWAFAGPLTNSEDDMVRLLEAYALPIQQQVEKEQAAHKECFRLAIYHQDRANEAEQQRDAYVTQIGLNNEALRKERSETDAAWREQLNRAEAESAALRDALRWSENYLSGIDWHGSLDPDYPQGFYVCADCEAKWKPNGEGKQFHNTGCGFLKFQAALEEK